MKFILCYDIPEDKRLRKVAKLMEGFGYRVQKSVFEAFLSKEDLEKLFGRLKKTMNEKEDSVRVYRLCEACNKEVKIMGIGKKIEDEPYIVI